MNKFVFFLLLTFFHFSAYSQVSENLIPHHAVTVFSINNVKLLNKISMDDLVQYEFMSEVQSELFDGSTNGKTLKDSGIDFNQKMNLFYGQNVNFEISGFTLGVKDTSSLFVVFDDFEAVKSNYRGVNMYRSNNNYLIIKGQSALVMKVEPAVDRVSSIADSLWYARGNGYFNDLLEEGDGEIEEAYDYEDNIDLESAIVNQTKLLDEDSSMYFTDNNSLFQLDSISLRNKNYYEMKDSISFSLQEKYLSVVCFDLFQKNLTLISQEPKFKEQISHDKDGVFYLNNGRNIGSFKGLWHFQSLFPELFNDLEMLYSQNVVVADVELNDKSIDIFFKASYGEELGLIYEKLNNSKFDKNVLKYIHKDAAGFFTYNINLKEGYNQAYNVIIPILSEEKDPRISSNVLMAELINEFLDTDALFDTYRGSMFGSFNGVKQVKTTRITYYYDESFQYGEKEEEVLEDMPVFTLGFSTNRADVPEKILKHIAKMTSRFENMGEYWKIDEAIFNTIPVYIINKNGLLIFTNDEDLVLNHSAGFGKDALSGKMAKRAKKSRFMYGYFNTDNTLNNLPREIFNKRQNEILDALRGKTGVVELTSTSISKSGSEFSVKYNFDNIEDQVGKYLLDVINSIYILSK